MCFFFYSFLVKFVYSEKATNFCEIFPLLLTTVHTVKSKGKISQNFVTFSEYMNFKEIYRFMEVVRCSYDENKLRFNLILLTLSENSNYWRESLLEVKFIYSEEATKSCEISTNAII